MHDHTGKQVATGMSPPIMITDDHKSNKIKAGRKRIRTDEKPTTTSSPFDIRHASAGSLFQQRQPPYSSFSTQYQIQPRPDTRPLDSPMMNLPSPVTLPSPLPLSSPYERTVSPAPIERPLLQRLIPNEGPTFGGVEVTVLGSGFRSGLTCMFGDVAASSTHYWSPNTLVCILPPAVEAGTVVVSFKEHPLVVDSQDVTLFTYYNENDRALMELALQVVGLKMTGKVEDARDIAMRIVQGGSSSTGTEKQRQGSTNQMSLEHHIIQVLQVMSTFRDVESADVSITSAQGHTMLHLAAMLGFESLTRSLIELGCDVDVTDKNGFTALHYSAWYNHPAVVDALLQEGSADTEISNMWNKKPCHLTENTLIRNSLWQTVHDYSDRMSADIDTDESDGSVWLSDEESLDGHVTAWRPSYLSDSSTTDDDDDDIRYEGLRHRRRHPLVTAAPGSIQYLNEEGGSTSHSADEILDAQPLFEMNPSTEDKEMNWMQRTLSHFQPPTTDSFLQNIKNNIPAKPAELNLKNIADHLLQFPRPATMIANMSELFSTDNKTQDEPDQTLAWYMALAYAMGARSNEEEKPFHVPYCVEMEAKKRRDKRLFSFWVPMLCRK